MNDGKAVSTPGLLYRMQFCMQKQKNGRTSETLTLIDILDYHKPWSELKND